MATRTAAATGNWPSPATWDGGASVPSPGDTIVIASPYTVTVDVDLSGGNAMLQLTINSGAALVAGNNFQTTQNTANSIDIQGTLKMVSGRVTAGVSGTTQALVRVGTAGKFICKTADVTANCELFVYGSMTTTGNGEYDVDMAGSAYSFTRYHHPSSTITNTFYGIKFVQQGSAKSAIAPLAADVAVNDSAITVPTPVDWTAGDGLWIGEFSNTNNKMTAYAVASVGATDGGNTTYNLTAPVAVKAVSAVAKKWGQWAVNRSQNVTVVNNYSKTVNSSDFSVQDKVQANASGTVHKVKHCKYDHMGGASGTAALYIDSTSAANTVTLNLDDILFEYTRAAGTLTRNCVGLLLRTFAPGIQAGSTIGNIVGVGYYVVVQFDSCVFTVGKIGLIAGFYVTNGSWPKVWVGYSGQFRGCCSKVVLHGNSNASPVGFYGGGGDAGSLCHVPELSDYVFEEFITMCGAVNAGYNKWLFNASSANSPYSWTASAFLDAPKPFVFKNVYSYFCIYGANFDKVENAEVLGCTYGSQGGSYDSLTVGQFNSDGISVNSGPVDNGGSGYAKSEIGTLTTTGTFGSTKVTLTSWYDLFIRNYVYSGSPNIVGPGSVDYQRPMYAGVGNANGPEQKRISIAKMNGVAADYRVSFGGVSNLLSYSSITPHTSCDEGVLFDPSYQYGVNEPIIRRYRAACTAGANNFTFKVSKSAEGFNGRLRFITGNIHNLGSEVVGEVTDVLGANMATYDGTDTGWTEITITLTTTATKSVEDIAIEAWDGVSSGSIYVSIPNLATIDGRTEYLIPIESGGGSGVSRARVVNGGGV